MYNFPIGVLLESFKTDLRSSLESAAELGLDAVQVHGAAGEMDALTVTEEKKKEFRSMIKDSGLVISAMCGDFICGNPDYSFSDPSCREALLDRSKRILDLAKELGTNIVTTHVGVIPEDHSSEKFKLLQATCAELAEYASSMDAYFAIETGPEIATTLKAFLDTLPSKGLAVNLDPANFVMVTGDDPVQAVYTLKDYIVHTHAKDGRRLMIEKPEIVYGEIETAIVDAQYFIELPLGEGDVDFANYLKALDDIGYQGYLTIEREIGENPKADIETAVKFLNKLKQQ